MHHHASTPRHSLNTSFLLLKLKLYELLLVYVETATNTKQSQVINPSMFIASPKVSLAPQPAHKIMYIPFCFGPGCSTLEALGAPRRSALPAVPTKTRPWGAPGSQDIVKPDENLKIPLFRWFLLENTSSTHHANEYSTCNLSFSS